MPIYEYLCKNCNEGLIDSRSSEDRDDLPECKSCGSLMKRLFSTPGVSFKGNGFYSTDK